MGVLGKLWWWVVCASWVAWAGCDGGQRAPKADRSGEAPGSDEDVSVRFPEQDAAPDLAPDLPDEPPALCDDWEPNDGPADALALAPLSRVEARVCEGDQDWFAVELSAQDRLTVALTFSHRAGDLDLVLYDPNLGEVARSESTDDDEALDVTVSGGGVWYLQVYGFEEAANTYAISATREAAGPEPAPCEPDAQEPDDGPADAPTLWPAERARGALCPGERDHLAVLLPPSVPLTLEVEVDDPSAQVVALGAGLRELARREGSGPLTIPAGAGGLALLRWEAALDAQPAQWSVAWEGPAPEEGSLLVRGALRFEDPYWNRGAGGFEFVDSPIRGATVELVELGGQGRVLASAQSDGAGRYKMLVSPADRQGQGYVRVLAKRAGLEGSFEVVTSERRLYAIRTRDDLDLSQGAELVADLDVGDGLRLSAPFNIVDAAERGFAWWAERVAPTAPAMQFKWEAGRKLDCGTCYYDAQSPPTVHLLGLTEDNDALDDPVLLHELGHFFQNRYSRHDSPGGMHDGTPVDPRLAFAEGWATALASFVRGEPLYYDTVGGGINTHDLETPEDDFRTFSGQRLEDPISEYLVAAILWDLYDEANDGADSIWASDKVLEPMTGYLKAGPSQTRGAAGVDLVDYLDGAACGELGSGEAIEARAQEADFPWTAPDAPTCKPSVPLWFEVDARGGVEVAPKLWVEGVELRACDDKGACAPLAAQAGDGPLWVQAPPSAAYVQARMWRGDRAWTDARPLPGRAPAPLVWSPAPPSQEGAPVVERRAAR